MFPLFVVALVFVSLLAVGVRAFLPRRASALQAQQGQITNAQHGRCTKALSVEQVALVGSSTRLCAVAPKQGKGKAGCKLCAGQGGIACAPCKGTGVDRKGGDIFQRYMCKSCKGFGLVGCSCTGGRGLTPEQTGER